MSGPLTPAMSRVRACLRRGSSTVTQLMAETGYARSSVEVAVSRLQQQGWITKVGKVNRGLGAGSGPPQMIYAIVDPASGEKGSAA